MTTIQTHRGIVRKGHIQLTPSTELPEGSHVYVIVAGQEPILDERAAQRKATRLPVPLVPLTLSS